MKSIDSIETYAYGMSKDLASEKEEIKCDDIIKQYKKWLTYKSYIQIILQKKALKSIIQIGQKFLITHTEY